MNGDDLHFEMLKLLDVDTPPPKADGCRWVWGEGYSWAFVSPAGSALADIYPYVEKDLRTYTVHSHMMLELHNGFPAQKVEGVTLTEVMHNAEFQARIAHAILIRDERHTAVSG